MISLLMEPKLIKISSLLKKNVVFFFLFFVFLPLNLIASTSKIKMTCGIKSVIISTSVFKSLLLSHRSYISLRTNIDNYYLSDCSVQS